jgi:transcriptional regulator with XRE-family HTH domain
MGHRSGTDLVTKLQLRLAERFGIWPTRQYDIARRLGIYPSRLSEYVQGRREIPWYVQMDLCMLLDCDPEEILGVADPSTYDLTDG